MTVIIPRESIEPLPVAVRNTRTGDLITTGVEFTITDSMSRPTSGWTAAVIDNSQTCVIVTGQTPGEKIVWARVGTVVLDAKRITIS